MRHEWDQLPKETPKAFAAFTIYRDLGESRSLVKVQGQVRKCARLIARWSAKFDWRARALAFDVEKSKIAIKAIEAAAANAAAEWKRREKQLKETEWAMHEAAIAAARRALDSYLTREKVYANLTDIARILEVASKLGRLATGVGMGEERCESELPAVRVEFNLALEKVYSEPLPGELVAAAGLSPEAARRLVGGPVVETENGLVPGVQP